MAVLSFELQDYIASICHKTIFKDTLNDLRFNLVYQSHDDTTLYVSLLHNIINFTGLKIVNYFKLWATDRPNPKYRAIQYLLNIWGSALYQQLEGAERRIYMVTGYFTTMTYQELLLFNRFAKLEQQRQDRLIW